MSSLPTFFSNRSLNEIAVHIPKSELNTGYCKTGERISDLNERIKLCAGASLAIFATCLGLSLLSRNLYSMRVGVSALLVGGGVALYGYSEKNTLDRYAKWSVALNPKNGPSVSKALNEQVEELVSSGKYEISFTKDGLTVSGVKGRLGDLTERERIKKVVESVTKWDIPSIVETQETRQLVNQAHDRWLSRIMAPIAAISLIGSACLLAEKKNSDKKVNLDDVAGITSSIYLLADFFTGKSVKEARSQLDLLFLQAKTAGGLLELIVEKDVLKTGALSCLQVVAEKHAKLNVRVDRFGRLIICPYRETSYGGPFPLHPYPKLA